MLTSFHKGVAPLILVLLIALGLAGGAAGGYTMREQIKKAVTGTDTASEIQEAIDNFKLGQSKFELEGVATSVDATNNIITVKIKSSTASIKSMRLSETPITVTTATTYANSSATNLKLADVPIDSQVHVAGTVTEGVLTATKVTIQKEEANTNQGERFSMGGTVTEIGTNQITINVTTANAKAKDKKGSTATVKTDSNTIIEKSGAVVALTDIKANDAVQVTGVISNTEYLASRIQIKVKEQAGELELEEEQNANQNQGNSTKNKETETEANTNSNNSSNSNSSNASNSNAGGNSTNNSNSNSSKNR